MANEFALIESVTLPGVKHVTEIKDSTTVASSFILRVTGNTKNSTAAMPTAVRRSFLLSSSSILMIATIIVLLFFTISFIMFCTARARRGPAYDIEQNQPNEHSPMIEMHQRPTIVSSPVFFSISLFFQKKIRQAEEIEESVFMEQRSNEEEEQVQLPVQEEALSMEQKQGKKMGRFATSMPNVLGLV